MCEKAAFQSFNLTSVFTSGFAVPSSKGSTIALRESNNEGTFTLCEVNTLGATSRARPSDSFTTKVKGGQCRSGVTMQ